MIVYKMVDGDIPFLSGAVSLVLIMFMLALAISSPSPLLTALIFVISLAGMSLFPFAANQLEVAELRKFDTERLVMAYNAYTERPDNISAVFEISRRLYAHGMKANAIGLAGAALNTLSKNLDPVSNKSFRDAFRSEEQTLKTWHREAHAHPEIMKPVPCPNCGHINPLETLICEKCKRPYLLDAAHRMHIKPLIYGRLVLAFATLAGVIVGSAAVGVLFSGLLAFLMLLLLLTSAGLFIHWLFRAPRAV